MQAVILAAGRGSRMNELTADRPKPMLEIGGKTLLELELDILPEAVDEVIIIVGYLGGIIREKLGGEYGGKRLLYVEQDVLDGTAGALWRAKEMLSGRFLVLMSDDLYASADVANLISMRDWALVVKEVPDMRSGGNVEIDGDRRILAITEGDHSGRGLMGTNLFALDARIFESELVPKAAGSAEYGLPQTVLEASKKLAVDFKAVPATFWFQITSPEDLKKAEDLLRERTQR